MIVKILIAVGLIFFCMMVYALCAINDGEDETDGSKEQIDRSTHFGLTEDPEINDAIYNASELRYKAYKLKKKNNEQG